MIIGFYKKEHLPSELHDIECIDLSEFDDVECNMSRMLSIRRQLHKLCANFNEIQLLDLSETGDYFHTNYTTPSFSLFCQFVLDRNGSVVKHRDSISFKDQPLTYERVINCIK